MAPRSSAQRDAVRAATRARIVDAARALFAERGFFACHVADVARRARMSPGNVYWHFESKEAILGAVLAEGYADLVSMAETVAGDYGPARRKLELLVDRTIDLYERDAAFVAIRAGLAGGNGRELAGAPGVDGAAAEARCRAGLRRVFAEARSEGAIVAAMDPDVATTLFLALLDGMAGAHAARWATLPRGSLRDAAMRVVGHRPAG